MNQDSVTVNRIDWLRSFPILQLSKALRMGFRLRTFLPCLLVSACFIISSFSISEVELSIDDDHWTVFSSPLSLPAPLSHVSEAVGSLGPNCPKPVTELLYGCAAYLLITTFLGITVARSTATEFCTATRTGAIQSLLFTAQHILSGLAAVTIMCLLASVPVVLLWLFGKIAIGIGTDSELLENVSVILGMPMAAFVIVTTIVCGLAWLFSIAAIGTDRCSGSDACSRGICYVLSHKAYALLIVFVAVVLSNIGAGIIRWLIWHAIRIARSELTPLTILSEGHTSETLATTMSVILANTIQLGVLFSGLTIGYILLRKAEDAVPLREIDGAIASTSQ